MTIYFQILHFYEGFQEKQLTFSQFGNTHASVVYWNAEWFFKFNILKFNNVLWFSDTVMKSLVLKRKKSLWIFNRPNTQLTLLRSLMRESKYFRLHFVLMLNFTIKAFLGDYKSEYRGALLLSFQVNINVTWALKYKGEVVTADTISLKL